MEAGPLYYIVSISAILFFIFFFPWVFSKIAKFQGSPNASLDRAFWTMILCTIVEALIEIALSIALPVIGSAVGLIICFLAAGAITGSNFKIGFGKGLVVIFLFNMFVLLLGVLPILAISAFFGVAITDWQYLIHFR